MKKPRPLPKIQKIGSHFSIFLPPNKTGQLTPKGSLACRLAGPPPQGSTVYSAYRDV
jgi:hypothetical protein